MAVLVLGVWITERNDKRRLAAEAIIPQASTGNEAATPDKNEGKGE